jgi:hypothetical protein
MINHIGDVALLPPYTLPSASSLRSLLSLQQTNKQTNKQTTNRQQQQQQQQQQQAKSP